MIEDKSAKFRQSGQNSRQVSAKVSAHKSDSGDSGSSGSDSSSGSGSAKGSSSGLSVDSSSNESMASDSDQSEAGESEQESQMLKKRKHVALDEKVFKTKEEKLADEVAQMENMTDKQKKKLQK